MTEDTLQQLLNLLPQRLRRIHCQPLEAPRPFIDLVRPFAAIPGTVALMSGGKLDSARYHLLGIQPLLVLTAKGMTVRVEHRNEAHMISANPFDVLQALVNRFRISDVISAPIVAGLLGYLSYDLKDVLEVLPRTAIDDLGLPDLYMTVPSILLVRDRHEKTDMLCFPLTDEDDDEEIVRRIEFFESTLNKTSDRLAEHSTGWQCRSAFRSGFTPAGYMDAIENIREYIAAGDVYQVNMSQRFTADVSGDAFELFAKMYAENPAPFFAWVNPGDHQILSTSPERFIELRNRQVETRPIKGTRPRGVTPEEDQTLKSELLSSPKDDSELSMIVDLLRNDIGKVCEAGSVVVTEHKRLETYGNVHHLISIVNGVLEKDKDAVDLIRATFPGGSITGCPKIRSMEVIDELEPVCRHLYTGSIGYVSFHDTMDLSIAIRTATILNGKMVFSVGGGIVYDSNPADEYQETLHKGRTLMRPISPASQSISTTQSYVWKDGMILPVENATVSVEDDSFLFGFGFFETIRVDEGRILMLEEHLDRFERAWETFFSCSMPLLSLGEIIGQVVRKNALGDRIAAVKILAAARKPGRDLVPYTLLVTAREYHHRLEGTRRSGLRLAVYPHRRHFYLADHKTNNYMFYKMAGSWAAARQLDEALICNYDWSISETNTGNIFCRIDGRLYFPNSRHALPGTFQNGILRTLNSWREPVVFDTISLDMLSAANAVFVSNSLMGVVPVISVDAFSFEPDTVLCNRLNEVLLWGV